MPTHEDNNNPYPQSIQKTEIEKSNNFKIKHPSIFTHSDRWPRTIDTPRVRFYTKPDGTGIFYFLTQCLLSGKPFFPDSNINHS